jgi:hypothetical protein
VLDGLSGDTQHVCRSPHKNIFAAPEEVNELAFLFQAQTGLDLDGLDWVLNIVLDSLTILGSPEGAKRGGHGRVGRRGLCVVAQLLQLSGSDRGSGQLDVVLLTVQCSLGLGLHGDDASRPLYLEFEVGVLGDEHELDITRPSQDNVVWSGEVNHLNGERLDVVVARVSESNGQINLPKGNGLLAWNHSIEWVWASFQQVPAQP